MLILKSQIDTSPPFMGVLLRLPFDQKLLIRKQVQTVCLYIAAESSRVTDPFRPSQAASTGCTCEVRSISIACFHCKYSCSS